MQQNFDEALKLAKLAASQNDVDGYLLLSYCYGLGFGVERDDQLAAFYMNMAHENEIDDELDNIAATE